MKNIIFFAGAITLLITTISCSKKDQEAKDYAERDYCTIVFESNKKTIYLSEDGNFVDTWEKDKNGKMSKKQTKLFFNKQERDSVLKYAYRIITHPALSKGELTCGAGENITIAISYCGTSISCKYSSISEWSKLSKDNKKLYELLNSKTAIPK